jgi:hypothetical protein
MDELGIIAGPASSTAAGTGVRSVLAAKSLNNKRTSVLAAVIVGFAMQGSSAMKEGLVQ